MAKQQPTIDEISAALRQYCADHPRAADTFEGVLRWWLPDSLRTVAASDMALVLEALVSEGAVTRRTLGDGSVVYFSQP